MNCKPTVMFRFGIVDHARAPYTQRLRTYLGAKISFDAGYCVIDCLVRDLSQDGAKLVLSETAILLATSIDRAQKGLDTAC